MAELPVLEELFLGGYDVSALLAGAPSQTSGQGLLGLEAQLQLKASALPQQALGWPSATPTGQNDLYQKVAQSLAAKLEEHRLQQVQVATALQQLQALQHQQELAQLQQQLNALRQHVPRTPNPFQRSRTTDLESLGRTPSYDVAGAFPPAFDFEQQQKQLAALQQAANPTTQHLVGLQRVPVAVGQHSLPVRSFSSEHLAVGQRRPPAQLLANGPPGQPMQPVANNKRAPFRQPSGLGPNGRSGNQGRAADGGRRARYAATAKAPSWASEDWHPMKAVIASGAHASGGTGVFLPHLAGGGGGGQGASSATPGPGGTPSASANNNNNSSGSNNKNASSGSNNNNNNNGGSGGSGGGGGTKGASTSSSSLGSGGSGGGRGGCERSAALEGLLHAAVLQHPLPPPPPPQQQSHPSYALQLQQPLATFQQHGIQNHPHHGTAVMAVLSGAAAAAAAAAAAGSQGSSQVPSPTSPMVHHHHQAEGSPACSVDSNAICSINDPYSRQTTLEFSRGSTQSEVDSHQPTSFGYMIDAMKVVVEEPEREREDAGEECDFVSLARELAELMSKQVIAE